MGAIDEASYLVSTFLKACNEKFILKNKIIDKIDKSKFHKFIN